MIQALNFILIISLSVAVAGPVEEGFKVYATTISEVQQQITETQNQIDTITNQIGALEDEQAVIDEMIDDLNSEIINTLASIGLKEEEIAVKEGELESKAGEITEKQAEIDITRMAYETAVAREEKQYDDMVIRIRRMYESGPASYLDMILQGSGLSGMLNRLDFVESIYEYDRQKLTEFEETRIEVYNLGEQLKQEKADLENDKSHLEQEKAGLEADRAELAAQKASLDTMLAKKKRESANYDAEIKKAKQEAAVAQKLLQQEKQLLAQLEAAQNQGENSAAANGNYTNTGYTKTIDNAKGSDLGKKVAKYACQYIGNPYVYGGTSLTNGADCSGFVYRVYKDFGYNLPRTSYQQRSAGTGVDYSNAQPGDLICYDGHIGIYIGGGLIVHASNKKSGIKVNAATYRKILAVRRII